MEKLDKDISNAAKIKVAGNYGAAALVTGTITYGGLLVGSEKVRKWTGEKVPFIGTGLEKFGQSGADFLKNLGERVKNLRKKSPASSSVQQLADGVKKTIGLREYYSTLKIPDLDKLNSQFPVSTVIDINKSYKLDFVKGDSERDLIYLLAQTSDHYGRWEPLILDNGNLVGLQMYGDESAVGGMINLVQNGLMDVFKLSDTRAAYYPTKKFMELMKDAKLAMKA